MAHDKNKIAFRYIKNHNYRVVHADGVIGGPSPSGDIHMAFFSQRKPIPRKVVYEITSDGLGPELVDQRESESDIIREFDTDVVMNLNVAKELIEWLQKHVSEVEKVISEQKETKARKSKNG